MTTSQSLQQLFDNQKRAFSCNPCPTEEERAERLDVITVALINNRTKIHEALREDFSIHPHQQADFVEIFSVIERLQTAKAKLSEWMQYDYRSIDPDLYGTSKAYIAPQPKGVIGNISPWNFPFELSLGPLAEMIAGGNSVIIKPSEATPACSALLKEMLNASISEDIVAVVPGDVELGKYFAALPWDHLLYTGSPTIGRLVAAAAAPNLTPLTLELGGKCPALFTEESISEENVGNMLRIKMIKNGQMCVAPDYVLVPSTKVDVFMGHVNQFLNNSASDYFDVSNTTGIINDRHLRRIEGLLNEAHERGCGIFTYGDTSANRERCLPLSMVINPPKDIGLMKEEIFGPVLPIVTYDSLDEALAFIQENERPLGIYVFTNDPPIKELILQQTHSGGVTFNSCAMHASHASMGFGGSGMSGYGRHHGIEGYKEFTNPKGVFDFDTASIAINVAPPYGDVADAIISQLTA